VNRRDVAARLLELSYAFTYGEDADMLTDGDWNLLSRNLEQLRSDIVNHYHDQEALKLANAHHAQTGRR
jgi:hypothetical protein